MRLPCVVLMVVTGCATPRTLVTPEMSAVDVWRAALRAHDGGKHVEQLSFFTHDVLQPAGLVEFFYPELAPDWVAHNVFDYGRARRCVQTTKKNGHVFRWSWDGTLMQTQRDGVPYAPLLGIQRLQHMRVNRWLFWPAHAMLAEHAVVERLAPVDGRPRLAFHVQDEPRDDIILELDPATLRVVAVDYTAKAVGMRGMLRAVLEDLRDVGGGVVVAHHLVEEVVVPGGTAAFHGIDLWDVRAALAPGRAAPQP